MSDFGELCPLFNVGLFREICFPYVKMSDATGVTDNFLLHLRMLKHRDQGISLLEEPLLSRKPM